MAEQPATSPTPPKLPSVEELRRRIGDERDALTAGLDRLAGEVGEATAAARNRVDEAVRKARAIAPPAAGAVIALLTMRALWRRRRRRH